jgi:bleomycin hydrolase
MSKISFFVIAVVGLFAIYANAENNSGSGAALDPDWVAQQLDQLSVTPMAAQIQSSGFTVGALNPAIVNLFKQNPNYTHEIVSGSIMDQKNTGNCWIYSSLSVLRSKLYVENTVDTSFQFSPNFVYFYSLAEKTNLYLNYVIALRNRDRKLLKLDQKIAPMTNLQDGGWWENVVFLAEKYGLVPKEAMPDTVSSLDDALLLQEAADVVSVSVEAIRQAAKNMDSSLPLEEQLNQLYAIKNAGIANVFRVMQTHLGKPPQQFTYKGVSYTPQSFFTNFLKINFSDYAHLSSYPTLQNSVHYVWKRSLIGTPEPGMPMANVDFLNTTNDRLQQVATDSVLGGYAPWLGIDAMEDMDSATGIMHPLIYDRQNAYGWPADQLFQLNPVDRMYLGILQSDHAVAAVGVDQPTSGGPTIKYKIENSWGTSAGTQGYFHMYKEWFQSYVFDVVVQKKFLTSDEISRLGSHAKVVPQQLGG